MNEESVNGLLAFIGKHGKNGLWLKSNYLMSAGCDGKHGSCCAKKFDMSGLLTGNDRPPFPATIPRTDGLQCPRCKYHRDYCVCKLYPESKDANREL